jgi:mxaJ protein
MSSRCREVIVAATHRAALFLGAGLIAAGCQQGPAARARPAADARSASAPPRLLRVCADPNNLPFSNRAGEGFENRLAALFARDLGAELRYTWWPQRRGFIRNTLRAGACDVVMGVPAGFEMVATTRPYYRSFYVFVARADRHLRVTSFDDPGLRRLRIGVQIIGDDYANAPPAHALAARHLARNVVGYPVYGDYSQPNPPARIVDAVAKGDVDLAVVWGPLAGYFASREARRLVLTPVSPEMDRPPLRFSFAIAMGVRRRDAALRRTLDDLILRRRADIDRLLAEYGVPRVHAGQEETADGRPAAGGQS